MFFNFFLIDLSILSKNIRHFALTRKVSEKRASQLCEIWHILRAEFPAKQRCMKRLISVQTILPLLSTLNT